MFQVQNLLKLSKPNILKYIAFFKEIFILIKIYGTN